jgi:NADPH-dependent 2,4-dienoyl-CoA reductase/sulfur reductase-like enzyme
MDRRIFLAQSSGILLTAASGLAWADGKKTVSASTPIPTAPSPGSSKARVIVIGGGMGGTTVAKYLRLWGNAIEVTLIEPNAAYTSNIMSSMVLTGQRNMASLSYSYSRLHSAYGVQVLTDRVVNIDTVPVQPTVTLASGTKLTADRIVLAPGIDFDDVPGLGNSNRMPHAWKAGVQTTLLAQQLAAMSAGGTVVLTVPKVPYRCPPGPYERACLIGDWLKVNKPGSKLIVLDANPAIVTEADNFAKAFAMHGITYVPNTDVLQVDPLSSTMRLDTSMGTFNANVVNLIPRQKAGSLVAATSLNNSPDGRFAAVNPLSYESTKAPRIHIIGDASATTQPKAGHIANQEAKVCADAIVRAFAGVAPDPAPVTNSACYSTITMTQASWLTAVFQYDALNRVMAAAPSSSGASVGWNTENFKEMNTWFAALMADSFA